MAPTVPQRGGLKPNEDVIMEDHDQLQQIPTRTPTPDAASNDHGDMLGSEDEGSLSSQDDDEDSDDDDDEDGDSDVVAGDDDPAILIEGHRPASTNDAPRPGERSHELAEPLERPGDLYTEIFPHAGHVYRKESPRHQKEWEHLQTAGKGNLFYPFANDVDFDLGTWLHESGLSRSKIDEFLKLKYVQDRKPSYTSANMLRDRIEMLSDGEPRWKQQRITPDYGKPTEPVTLFYRDVMESVAYLLSRPNLAAHMEFAPRKVWTDPSKQSRVYSEMSTGDWWWDVQASLKPGSSLLPLVIGSDKTNLTNHAGDQKAWPVYMSLGNISMKARRTRSLNAWVIIGYMPVVSWDAPAKIRTTLTNRLFHQCAKVIFQSIIDPGLKGTPVTDSAGHVRYCFPRLAAWLADYPEQIMINCAAGNTCPTTLAGYDDLGSSNVAEPRTTEWILQRIGEAMRDTEPENIQKYQETAHEYMLNGVHKPFWENLPGYRADLCVSPDILHGVLIFWRDHIFRWIKRLVGVHEIDNRLKVLQPVVGFRHFKKGISHLSQWTGREDRELQRVMVAIIAGSTEVSDRAMRCIRAFHDFLYLVQYRSHSTETIGYLKDYLKAFHNDKNVFIETGVRTGKGKKVIPHFKIPKIASLHAYGQHIPQLGSSTQYTSELIETLHRTLAKDPFRVTNKRGSPNQMCRQLDRKSRISHTKDLLDWISKAREAEKTARALASLSPGFQQRVKDDILPSPLSQNDSELQRSRQSTRLWLNLVPRYSRMLLEEIATLYRLPSLIRDLDAYLQDPSMPSSERAERGIADVLYADVWDKVRIRVPDIQNDEEFSHIHTVGAYPPDEEGRYPFGNGHCVLVHNGEETEDVGIEGYGIAQARLFVKVYLSPLRESLSQVNAPRQAIAPQMKKSHEPRSIMLAYVQYFNRPENPDMHIQMYRVSRDQRAQNQRLGTFIPFESIVRFVQLIPRFDARVDSRISAENSMEICRNYYLNSFATHQIFQSVY